MRTHTAISLLVLLITNSIFGQQPFVQTYIERTVAGTKHGLLSGYEWQKGYELGGFYQAEIKQISDPEVREPVYEKEFFGVYAANTLLEKTSFSLKMGARVGVTNRENFAIVPSVMMRYHQSRHLDLDAGVSVRCISPSIHLGIRLK